MAIPKDTSPEAAAVQLEVLRQMSPSRRSLLGAELCEMARVTAMAGIRSRHPDYTERQVFLAFVKLTLGDELFSVAYPDITIEP